MKLLIVSDAWYPQTNGVVRTLEETTRALERMGHIVHIVGPEESWHTFSAPTYPDIKLEFFANRRLQKILDTFAPDYIHISTEGPLGAAMRRVCLQRDLPFSTAYHTCFPEYLEKRCPPFLGRVFANTIRALIYEFIRLFHAPSGAVMVATPTMENLLKRWRVKRMRRWSRGVDVNLFHPRQNTVTAYADLPRPIYLYVGRIAVEKNLEAFLKLDLKGSKVVIGEGPNEAAFRKNYKDVIFLGKKTGEELARHYAGADVFVFPSQTDTFGLVLLEALASGLAIAAYPVQGPLDVFADKNRFAPYVALDNDLQTACTKAAALHFDKEKAHQLVTSVYSWHASAEQFLHHLQAPTPKARKRVSRYRWTLNLLDILGRRLRTYPKFLPNIYRALCFVVAPLLPFYLNWRADKGKEDIARLNERFGKPTIPRPSGKLIWCHAASVGESVSLLPLLERLHNHSSQPTLLLTTGTRSSAELLATRLPSHVIHQYVPLDTPAATLRFIKHWQPDLAMITESELWPNLLGKLRRFAIPAALINGRMSARSAARWQAFAHLWIARLLSVFDIVLAQSEGDAERLRSLGAYGARSVGNLKAAGLSLPVNPDDCAILKKAIGDRPVWLFASSHEGEEFLAGATHQKLKKTFPNLLTIIAPRHPERADLIAEQLHRQSLVLARRSQNDLPNTQTDIYLADTMGEMDLLYVLCPIICMGGSFAAYGGHNPLEPARHGAAILFGPDMRNTGETAQAMQEAGAARQVADAPELEIALHYLLTTPETARIMGKAAMRYAEKEKQVLDRVMLALQPLLDKALKTS